jgi:Flp pilus assembly pilin Flp
VTQWRSLVPKRESGQAVVEYALVLALVAAGLLVGLLLFRSSLGGAYGSVADRVQAPRSGSSSETGAIGPEADGGSGAEPARAGNGGGKGR